jgi:hypothetical protein
MLNQAAWPKLVYRCERRFDSVARWTGKLFEPSK